MHDGPGRLGEEPDLFLYVGPPGGLDGVRNTVCPDRPVSQVGQQRVDRKAECCLVPGTTLHRPLGTFGVPPPCAVGFRWR